MRGRRTFAWLGAIGVLGAILPVAAAATTPAELDELFAHRDAPDVAPKLEARTRAAWLGAPTDFELLWRAARERTWAAESATDLRLKKQAGKEARDLGERAIAARADRAEGYYYSANGAGAVAEAAGIVEAVRQGIQEQFLSRMEKAAQLDPKLDHGGPLLALGRYFAVVPWPTRDTARAEKLFRQVLADFPESLRARLYLAELKLKGNQEQEARALVAEVESGPVDYDPAEGRRVQHLARQLTP